MNTIFPNIFLTEKPLPEKIQNQINIFINQNDCVPRLSLANLAKLIAMARAIDGELSSMSLEIKDYLKILAVVDDEKVNEIINKLSAVTSKVNQDQFPNLDHVGMLQVSMFFFKFLKQVFKFLEIIL